MMSIYEIHAVELRIETNVYDPRSFYRYLSSSEKDLKFQARSVPLALDNLAFISKAERLTLSITEQT